VKATGGWTSGSPGWPRLADEPAGRTEASTGPTPEASPRIDAVLAALPADMRDALQGLRETIAAAAPQAVEAFSYGAPAFRYRGRPLVAFNAGKAHCALYVMSPAVMDAHRAEFESYDTSRGTIRFMPAKPLPTDLVTKLVRARMAETDAPGNPR
jgi:uncharacterized protein YdhG (YjbR/CyaY superfamily)